MTTAKQGQKTAAYYHQGSAEVILQGPPLQTIFEPKGAVAQKGKDQFLYISDVQQLSKRAPSMRAATS